MLPGFRFLFAAIVLSTSVLIFGLGAAALLRAAHEEFASLPSRRAPPEIMFAQQSDARPTLAILRVEPSVAEKRAAKPASDNVQAAAAVEQPTIKTTAPEPEKLAAEPDKIAAPVDVATPTENSSPSEVPKSEAAASEVPVQVETPTRTEAPSPVAETKVAAIAEPVEVPNQIAVTAPVQASAPTNDSTRIAETRIATLGGPAVTIETNAPAKLAPMARKSAQAKRVVKRRRIAQRARVAQPAPQAAADPFAQPLSAGPRTR
jgi:hypothetical protein